MTITNQQSGTNVHEVTNGIYRINTPLSFPNGVGFSFNQYLIADDEPLLFHTGPRKMFALVREAVASVLPVESLRYIGFSHVEADECGSLNDWLAVAPQARPSALNAAVVETAGDVDPANDRDVDPTPARGVPDLSLDKRHAAPFGVGAAGGIPPVARPATERAASRARAARRAGAKARGSPMPTTCAQRRSRSVCRGC